MNGWTKMTDQKLNLNISWGEIRYLEVPDIINYELVKNSKRRQNLFDYKLVMKSFK